MGLHDTLLSAHRVLRTSDLDEARAAVSERYCDHKLDLASGASLSVAHNHVRGVNVSLNLLGYGGEVSINPGELQDFYLLQLPLSGSARILHRGEEVDANTRCGTILSPDRPSEMLWGSDCQKLMVQIDAGFLAQVATEATGTALPGPVRFSPRVDMALAPGKRLRNLSLSIARAIENEALSLHASLPLLSVERQITRALLDAQPSNISHMLSAAPPALSAPHLRRAVDFIQENHHRALTLSDIATASGAHPRTLQVGFRKAMGQSPTGYLRDVRLDHARYHLMQRRDRAAIAQIAFDVGYSHLGRFSRDFRERFGQSPSEI